MKIKALYFLLALVSLWGFGQVWFSSSYQAFDGASSYEFNLPEVKCVHLSRSKMDEIGVYISEVGLVWFISDYRKCDFYRASKGDPVKIYLVGQKVLNVELSGESVSSYSKNRFRHNGLIAIVTLLLPFCVGWVAYLQSNRAREDK